MCLYIWFNIPDVAMKIFSAFGFQRLFLRNVVVVVVETRFHFQSFHFWRYAKSAHTFSKQNFNARILVFKKLKSVKNKICYWRSVMLLDDPGDRKNTFSSRVTTGGQCLWTLSGLGPTTIKSCVYIYDLIFRMFPWRFFQHLASRGLKVVVVVV